MPSSYSNALRLELIANGEQVGNWGNTTNRNLGQLLEQSVTGVVALDITTGDRTLLALNGAVDEARAPVLLLTGAPTGAVTITVPNANKQYVVKNNTDVTVEFNTAAGVGYTCPAVSTSQLIVRALGAGVVLGTSVTDAMAVVLAAESLAASIEAMGVAPIDSPVFTGTPTAPTAADGSNTTQIATTAFVIRNSAPSGGVIFWPKTVASIPTGWLICDGTNGTPNMMGVFPMGLTTGYEVGDTGGSADAVVVTHDHGGVTSSSGAAHSHSFVTNSTGTHSHLGAVRYGSGGRTMFAEGGGGWIDGENNTTFSGDHAHSGTTNTASANHTHTITSAGTSGVNANLPPFFVGVWIQKA